MKTRYVVLNSVWQGNRWTTECKVLTEPPTQFDQGFAAYECKAKNNKEAIGIVMTWLVKGRPSIMEVRELFS